MNPDRVFLDWSTPATDGIGNWLLADTRSSPVDLSDTLTLAPTRQAGRRLREALALRCAARDTALIPPIVKESLFFMDYAAPDHRVATPLQANAVWTVLLRELDPTRFPGLFPLPPPRRDLAWAARTAEQIQRVRNTLAEGGLLMRDVPRQHGNRIEEPERWDDLARLETEYLNHLEQNGWTDRAVHLIRQSESPACPPDIRRIVVAAVPDPSPLMIRALNLLKQQLPVIILIHAPDSWADHFDEWGRPLPAAWHAHTLSIPDAEQNIHLGATPQDQARITLEIIAEEATHIGPSDLAIGVPDLDVAPYVDTLLSEHGLIAFNPSGTPMNRHRLYYALDACRALFADPSYRAVSNLLRQPDVLLALENKHGVDTTRLLADLDRLQNTHLPQTLDDLLRLTSTPNTRHPTPDTRHPTPNTRHAITFIERLAACAESGALEHVVAALMEQIYSNQTIHPQTPEDDAFCKVAARINRFIAETRESLFTAQRLTTDEAMELLLRALANETWYEERKDAQIDLEGWLELPWNNARLLIVTGFNDGRVPDGRVGDVFLPDTLRTQIGLRSDAERLARDAYLMTALIESRRSNGRVCFIAGAFSRSGDPLRPSRLLFRCEDPELPARAALLFREPDPNTLIHPASISFTLDTLRDNDPRIPETLGVTAFRAYLACPFRFYLRYVLRMEERCDNKIELDALDFGHLVHYALQGLREQPTCADKSELTALFISRAEYRLREQFGARPPLSVRMQFESVKQRLNAAAAIQADIARDGWVPIHFEQPIETTINGMRIKGVIDRADYHPDRKQWRIMDYKTKDQREPPEHAHIGKVHANAPDYAFLPGQENKQWHDLQLPLYVTLFRAIEPDTPVTAGLFQLPRAVTDTQLDVWDTLTEERIQSAWDSAAAIVADIQAGRFWPPADTVEYDSFAPLFPRPADQCVKPWPPHFSHKVAGGIAAKRRKKTQKGETQ